MRRMVPKPATVRTEETPVAAESFEVVEESPGKACRECLSPSTRKVEARCW
jgi:hypothetical protein